MMRQAGHAYLHKTGWLKLYRERGVVRWHDRASATMPRSSVWSIVMLDPETDARAGAIAFSGVSPRGDARMRRA